MQKVSTFDLVTEKFWEQLQNVCVPWGRPWCVVRKGARNRVRGRTFSLLNQMLLTHGPGEYASFKQRSANSVPGSNVMNELT